ncbi:MAG: hypothetical protein EXS17_06685 [Phycisphaerales bacterium]|nr:hypothetical protein [Phycisphaerales bacterium]
MKLSPLWIWTVVSSAVSLVFMGFVALPNFQQSRQMRSDSRNLSKATDAYLIQRDELERLRDDIASLREKRDSSGHSARSDLNESRLVSSLTRPIDGTEVVDQSIRIGDREPVVARPAGLALDRRSVEMQMTGSFDAVFSTLRTAEAESGLTRVRSIELHRTGPQVQATVGIDEFFHASLTEEAP